MPILPGYRLAETIVDLIQTQIQDNIVAALQEVRLLHHDASVTLEPPQEYFIWEQPAHVYRAPAIFTILQDQDIQDQAKNPNHINSFCLGYVAAVLQDRLQRSLVIKSWRYQAALMKLLHQVSLTNSDSTVKLFIRVQNCVFSGVVNLKNPNTPETVFRKEVSLKLHIEHIENLQLS